MFKTPSTTKALELYERAKTTAARMKAQSEEMIGEGMKVVEVGGVAFGLGYMHERYGKIEKGATRPEYKIAGVSADLAIGVGCLAAAIFGAAGKYTDHVYNVSAGALATYGVRSGQEMGAAALKKHNAGPQTSTGYLPQNHRDESRRNAEREGAYAR